jgi:H+-transporting ATPase
MLGSDIRDFVEHADGFAEVFPEHKYQVNAAGGVCTDAP